ncbi:MAG: hypothetical protein KJP00_13185 [Bacteroidia bacterium]|nr:hypothetical protein [Bacteroidia bacterium]
MKIKLKGKTDCSFDIIADGCGNFKIFHFENLEQDTTWYNDFYSDTLTVVFKPQDICFTGDLCICTKIM